MKRLWLRIKLRNFADTRGSVATVFGFAMLAFIGICAITADAAILYQAKSALQTSANLAVLAGAQDINCCTNSPGTAVRTATDYTATAGKKNVDSRMSVALASGYPAMKCLTSVGIACTGPDAANAIVVKQTASVPLMFGKALGRSAATLAATATAIASGGKGTSYDIMLLLDTTASMNTADSSCSVSGATSLVCAIKGAQALLTQLTPSLVQVGLMTFPGVTNATQASYDYDCSTTKPTIAKYSASPLYQIVGLASDFKTSDSANTLNAASNLVRALQAGGSGCAQGISAVGGVGTYYADAITAAQNALTTSGRAGVQKVIILLSDGDASASSSNLPTGKATNQCHAGITAATAATGAGILVYSAAYGASTAAVTSCSTDSPQISACAAMQQMASRPSLFFAANRAGAAACISPANGATDLVAAFIGIGQKLSPPRLVSNDTL